MLKALMLRKKINDKKKALADAEKELEKLQAREAELEEAINEAETQEEQEAVEEEIEAFENDKADAETKKSDLEKEISDLENDLAEEERAQDTTPADQPQEHENRNENEVFEMRNRKDFFGMNAQERDAFINREDVKGFLDTVKTAIKEKRAISGVGEIIPEVFVGLIREAAEDYSKLYKHVNVQRVPGTGRMVIEGGIPEAVWTEMCANVNELDLGFKKIEVDGYKVGGYFRVCNAVLEDNNVNLARELVYVLGQAIGYALDKAILYGTGTKMPEGIVKALSGVEGTPNIVSHAASVKGIALFQELAKDSGKAASKYTRQNLVWVMNDKTKMELVSQAMSVNAAGAIVTGLNNQMPVVGGDIETLNDIPDNIIVTGHFDMYLLAERAGQEFSTSEHAFWVADQTGFKGTARYDGKVVDENAFVAIGINGATVNAGAVTFAEDKANAEG